MLIRDIRPPAVLSSNLFRAVYLPIVQTWEQAQVRILATYERTLAEMMTDSPADVQADLDNVEREIERLLLILTPRLRDWALRTEKWGRGKWRGAVLSATGIDLQTLIGPEDVRETIETFIARNVALVKDVGSQARGRIADAVFRGLNQRRAAREVAADIREAVEMGRRRALGIASHQLADLSNRLADERRRQAGLPIWEWVHSRKANPRLEHVARDGDLYSDDPSLVGKVVNGKTVKAPPPDRPGEKPHCGCRARGVLVFD